MIIKTVEEMISLGEKMSKEHSHILLIGELGAGKTHFTKGFAKGLNIDTNLVQSPTYTYINKYNQLLHIDMYRIEEAEELISKGIVDEIINSDYCVIEWPKYENLYDDHNWITIKINKIDKNTRKITIN